MIAASGLQSFECSEVFKRLRNLVAGLASRLAASNLKNYLCYEFRIFLLRSFVNSSCKIGAFLLSRSINQCHAFARTSRHGNGAKFKRRAGL